MSALQARLDVDALECARRTDLARAEQRRCEWAVRQARMALRNCKRAKRLAREAASDVALVDDDSPVRHLFTKLAND